MSPPGPDSETLTLSVPPTVYCPGSDVQGEVLLDFRKARQQNLHLVLLKLRGSAHTTCPRIRNGQNDPASETLRLIDCSLDLWAEGAAYPSPGTDILHLPFSIRLPDDAPPSFCSYPSNNAVYIKYELTTAGLRSGAFQDNLTQRMLLDVMPKDERGAVLRETISFLGWRKREQVARFRKGLWRGDCSTVHVELLLPNTPEGVFPLLTDIPFIIKVTTTTAPITRAKADKHPEDKPIFLAPPATHNIIRFRLLRTMRVRAGNVSYECVEDAAYFLGGDTSRHRTAVTTDLSPTEWVVMQPSGGENQNQGGEEKGVWVQRVRYQSKMKLHVAPTFLSKTIDCRYSLDLMVPFVPGPKVVCMKFPVTIVSGIDGPLLRTPRLSSQVETDAPGEAGSAGTPQSSLMQELAPAYWDVAVFGAT